MIKEDYITALLERIRGAYTQESGVYIELKKGLTRMSHSNLSALYLMIMIAVKKGTE